jgi:hypothetical protein
MGNKPGGNRKWGRQHETEGNIKVYMTIRVEIGW